MKTNREVEAWFETTQPPAAEAMRVVRKAILTADPRVTEYMKYGTPTFAYQGDIAAFVQWKQKTVTLMFNRGAKIPGRFPHFEGSGPTARFMRFEDAKEAAARAGELSKIVVAWCEVMNAPAASHSVAKKTAKRKVTPKRKR